jgi:hypothetical protein
MTKKELKQYQNVSMLEVLGACLLGAIIGSVLALTYVIRTGGF